ncbi:MAG: hypothetical protein ABI051_17395 [Vicinamibacterales bacterium]
MAPHDGEIDRLYQGSLGQFTSARNALAPKAGDRRAFVKGLQKPSTAAWAVNQLYWHRRAAFDRLVDASDRLRATQVEAIRTGQSTLVGEAEAHHDAALRAAFDDARALLQEAGEKPSLQVMTDVRETLQALPSDEFDGRLVRPLKPLGFAALLKMFPAGAIADRPASHAPPARREAAVPAHRDAETTKPAASHGRGNVVDEVAERRQRRAEQERTSAQAEREAAAVRKRRRADLERQLRGAQAAERERAALVTTVRDELARAERELKRSEAALEAQRAVVARLTEKMTSVSQQAHSASDARADVERQLKGIG